MNTFLAVVALLAMGRLVPHLQSQAAQLEDVNLALSEVEASTSQLKVDFGVATSTPGRQKILCRSRAAIALPLNVRWSGRRMATAPLRTRPQSPKGLNLRKRNSAAESFHRGAAAAEAEASTPRFSGLTGGLDVGNSALVFLRCAHVYMRSPPPGMANQGALLFELHKPVF